MTSDFSFLPAFVEVTPRLLTSGQPAPNDFARLREAGVGAIINLAAPGSTNYNPDEQDIVRGLGIRYAPIPVTWQTPEYQRFLQFLLALKFHYQTANHVTLVHCALNMRVSAFVYLVATNFWGEEESTARARMERIWTPNETWQGFIDDVSRHIATHPDQFHEMFSS